MSRYRCPKHDVVFEANKAPTQDGHKKCPQCNPPKDEHGKAIPAAATAVAAPSPTVDKSGLETE